MKSGIFLKTCGLAIDAVHRTQNARRMGRFYFSRKGVVACNGLNSLAAKRRRMIASDDSLG